MDPYSVLTIVVSLLQCCHSLMVEINMETAHAHVEPEFLSVNIDTGILAPPRWRTFNFSCTRTQTLLKGLSPSYLRFGGTSADYTVYSDEPAEIFQKIGVQPEFYTLTSIDIDRIVGLVRKVNFKFLLDLNLQLRYGKQWDPSNTAHLLAYLKKNGYDDVFNFEMGNEPDLYVEAGLILYNGTRIGKDFEILHKLLTEYNFTKFTFVGPDCAGIHKDLIIDFIKEVGNILTAVTFHHYYFNGKTAKVSDYINPVHFDNYENEIRSLQEIMQQSATPELPIWLGEGADGFNSGTPNVSDRYVSGFLWLDKLGLSAANGLGVVMRQTFYGGNYALTDVNNMPNPDYWLSYVHKHLVGQTVLQVTTKNTTKEDNTLYWQSYWKLGESASASSVRVYAHCTKASTKYTAGAITMFALSVQPSRTETLTFPGILSNQPVHVYLLTPVGPDGMTSKQVALNGKTLELVDDHTLPDLIPKEQSSSTGVKLPPLTFGFFVFPKANAKACL